MKETNTKPRETMKDKKYSYTQREKERKIRG
jgi:hypothetical protein